MLQFGMDKVPAHHRTLTEVAKRQVLLPCCEGCKTPKRCELVPIPPVTRCRDLARACKAADHVEQLRTC